MHNEPKLILASSSPYRRELLQKLGLTFIHNSPDIDESDIPGESPKQLVERLAFNKANALSQQYPSALIIGSDQVAVLDDNIITKPHTHENAVKQLQSCSGRRVTFLTSLCLLNTATLSQQSEVCTYTVEFLELNNQQIEAYLRKEKPYECAGSFKAEGLGVTLFKSLSGEDPNSLIGLPLIALCKMLRKESIEPLTATLQSN